MNRNDKECCNCTNKAMLDMLEVCPIIIEELRTYNCSYLMDAYDSILPKYNMDWYVYPIYNGDTEKIVSWSYNYTIDGTRFEMNGDKGYNTRAEAQLAAAHATMYELRSRIEKASPLRIH